MASSVQRRWAPTQCRPDSEKAEEYPSHEKTFEIPEDATANIVGIDTGKVLLSHNVEVGTSGGYQS